MAEVGVASAVGNLGTHFQPYQLFEEGVYEVTRNAGVVLNDCQSNLVAEVFSCNDLLQWTCNVDDC